MKQTTEQTFQTHDLYLSAALKLRGFKLLDLKQDGNGRGVFVFQDQPDRQRFVKSYFSGELTGSLKGFANSWADLKGFISEMERK